MYFAVSYIKNNTFFCTLNLVQVNVISNQQYQKSSNSLLYRIWVEFCVCPKQVLLCYTWLKFGFDPWHQVVLLQNKLVIQIRDGQITQNSQAFQSKFLIISVQHRTRQVTDVVLMQHKIQISSCCIATTIMWLQICKKIFVKQGFIRIRGAPLYEQHDRWIDSQTHAQTDTYRPLCYPGNFESISLYKIRQSVN